MQADVHPHGPTAHILPVPRQICKNKAWLTLPDRGSCKEEGPWMKAHQDGSGKVKEQKKKGKWAVKSFEGEPNMHCKYEKGETSP